MPKSGGRPLCMCHYCSGVSQGEITSALKSATRHLHPVHFEAHETILAGSSRGEEGERRRALQVGANEPVQAKDYTQLASGTTQKDVPRWTQNTGAAYT